MARKEKLTFNKDIRSEVKLKVHTAAAEIPNMYPQSSWSRISLNYMMLHESTFGEK